MNTRCQSQSMGTLFLVAALLLVPRAADAQIYKCEANGSVVYQQKPCETGPGSEIKAAPNTMNELAPGGRSRPANLAASRTAAGTFDEATKAQRNGMWESFEVAEPERRSYFCVTDDRKIDPRKSLTRALGGNCQVPRDSFAGGRFELEIRCTVDAPDSKEFGTISMSLRGTASPTEMRSTFVPKLTGNSPRLAERSAIFRAETTEQSKWKRACRAEEKPGPQHVLPADAVQPPETAKLKDSARRPAPPGRPEFHELSMDAAHMYKMGDSAFIEGLGVYRAANSTGQIDVRVRKSTRPLILVLSSNDPVRWNLSLDAGAELLAVLTSGSISQTTAGAGAIFVIDLGRLERLRHFQSGASSENSWPKDRASDRQVSGPVRSACVHGGWSTGRFHGQ